MQTVFSSHTVPRIHTVSMQFPYSIQYGGPTR